MNATFQMSAANPGGTILPRQLSPGGTTYNVPAGGGVVSVNTTDVQLALNFGWQMLDGQGWPYTGGKHMQAPAGAPQSGTLTMPDGQTVTVTAGIGLIPYPFVQQYRGYGWAVTGWGE